MTKMQVFRLLADTEPGNLDGLYYFDQYLVRQDGATSKRAIFVDSVTDRKMVVYGHGLEYDSNSITEGSITRISFFNESNKKFLTASDLKMDAAAFEAEYDKTYPSYLIEYMLRGNDVIAGSDASESLKGYSGKDTIHGGGGGDSIIGDGFGDVFKDRLFGDGGNDSITGGGGNDRMTGGKGSDTFVFYGISGRDVITDFDAKGGGIKQDYLDLGDHGEFTVKRDGHDIVLKFLNSDTIRLQDVAFKDFNAEVDII